MKTAIPFSPPSLSVFKNHYLKKASNGDLIEKTPDDVFQRVEAFYVSHGLDPVIAAKMRDLQATKQFSFNSPIYYNAGVDNERPQLSACFVGNLQDSMESITDHVKRACTIFQSGAGLGFNIGSLRPRWASVGDGGMTKAGPSGSSGPLSFMELFQASGNTVMSAGKRRAAMWTGMRYDHPDTPEFIKCKRGGEREKYTNMNISLIVDDEFARLYEEDAVVEFNWNGQTDPWGSIKARNLMKMTAESVWLSGDPGLMFVDVINRHNTTPTYGRIICFNPCVAGETIVQTVDGPRTIRDITLDENEQPFELFTGSGQKTTGIAFCNGQKHVVRIDFASGQTLTCTPDHELVTPIDGKVPVGALEIGRSVYLAGHHGTTRISGITPLPEPIPVYDINVEHDEHTFIANGLSISNCGEIALPPDSSCNLGAVVIYNVLRFLEAKSRIQRRPDTKTFDWNENRTEILAHINHVATVGMEHLDKNIDINHYPDELFAKNTQEIRSTGLGLSGLGEAFCALGVPYGSPEAITIGGEIMNEITYAATEWSFRAAEIAGPCPASHHPENAAAMKQQLLHYANNCDQYEIDGGDRWRKLAKRCKPGSYRNSYPTCIAPTGNTGIAFDAGSYGMEPIPGIAFQRNTRDGILYFADQEFEIQVGYDPNMLEDIIDAFGGSVCRAMTFENVDAFMGSLSPATVDFMEQKYKTDDWRTRIRNTWENINTSVPPRILNNFLMMHDVPWDDRIQQQEVLQSFVALSISSTINVPHDTSADTVSKIYLSAMRGGVLKGVTVYRDGSIQFAPMTMTKDTKDALPDTMPSQDTKKMDAEMINSQEDTGKMQKVAATKTSEKTYPAPGGATEYGSVVVREKIERPTRTVGSTVELVFDSGVQFDKFYVTINEDPNAKKPRPIEVFVAGGRHGENTPAMNQAIGRLISGWLQDGAPVYSIVKKLIGIKGDHRASVWFKATDERPTPVLSIPDAIGKLLQREYLDSRQVISVPNGVMCPKCYHNTLVYGADGKKCWRCHNLDCGHYLC